MKVSRLTAVAILLILAAAVQGRTGLRAQAELSPPQGVAACQAEYGLSSSSTPPLGPHEGVVILSWTNPETYEAVEFSLDGQPAPGEVDGARQTGRVIAPSGAHTFGVRGVEGERVSAFGTVELTVLEESPLREPIANLKCELVPGQGGALRVSWELGPDAWVSGRLEVPGRTGFVPIEAGARAAQIAAGSEAPNVAVLTFKDRNNYFSLPITPTCLPLTPSLRRGDCDVSGRVNITDPIFELDHLFRGGPRWFCDDACDANDDGKTDISDPIWLLNYLFRGGPPPPPPGPRECGVDFTGDFLGGVCECRV
jgi:hypothetical protein